MFCRVLIAIVFAFFFVLPGFAQDGGSDDVDAVTSEFNEGPAPNADASNKKLAQLGERLFFDPHLSGSGRTACASCHNPDFAFSQPERNSATRSGGIFGSKRRSTCQLAGTSKGLAVNSATCSPGLTNRCKSANASFVG